MPRLAPNTSPQSFVGTVHGTPRQGKQDGAGAKPFYTNVNPASRIENSVTRVVEEYQCTSANW